MLPWEQLSRCHSASFVMYISGAKFEDRSLLRYFWRYSRFSILLFKWDYLRRLTFLKTWLFHLHIRVMTGSSLYTRSFRRKHILFLDKMVFGSEKFPGRSRNISRQGFNVVL